MLKVLDLFSGVGGFSLGLERAGMKTTAFCEIDPFCKRVLNKHWPEVPVYDDVRTLTADTLRRDRIGVDVICGGFPCQGISEAGLRQGLQDPRSALWFEYARLVSELRPRFVVVENVSELLRNGMDRVIGDLAESGYDAEWYSIPALAVGADHIRERIWIIAYPNESGAQVANERRGEQRKEKMGQDAAAHHANPNSARLPGWVFAGALREDARAIGPRLGLAIGSEITFPDIDRAGPPVLGRGENGIPNRVDRCRALGNAVVPQIPELIGRAILGSIDLEGEKVA